MALALSLLVHLVAVGGALLAAALYGGRLGGPLDVEITGMRLDEVKDLPLGPAPGGDRAAPGQRRPHARRRAAPTPDESGSLASRASAAESRAGVEEPQDNPDAEVAPGRASELRQYGPEGSRLTVLLRLDRLKVTPYVAAVDALLMRLPDRRDLLEGTGLDLYDGFDALLIATPDPRDPSVTFLAARHHLTDAAVRAALDRGARASGHVIVWRTEGRRPFAERHARAGSSGPAAARDERLIVLPAPGLVVVTPPAYRPLLLARRRPAVPDGGEAATVPDGGADAAAADASPSPSWSALLRRIDAEDGVMPANGIAMMSAVDIFKASSTGATAVVYGMEVPRALTAVLGIDGDPFVDITAEFASEAEARHWEKQWPELQRKLRVNPYAVLLGFVPLLTRATLTREGTIVHLHETATADETTRLLDLAARATVR
jgi:hypothetical protein